MSEPSTPSQNPIPDSSTASAGCLSLTLVCGLSIGGAIAVMYVVQWLTGH